MAIKDSDIEKRALAFARREKNAIARRLTDIKMHVPSMSPVSVFMAGSPGAGKTEFSKNLVAMLEEGGRKAIRIDGDELRGGFPEYTGTNSRLFQKAISIIVDKIHDEVLAQKQNFVLDGTFSKCEKAIQNINRSLKKGRSVFVMYVYQAPDLVWRFTQAREKAEGRNIPQDVFIEQFLGARETVAKIVDTYASTHSETFGAFLVKKDFESNRVEAIEALYTSQDIDAYISRRYAMPELQEILV